MTVAVYPQQTRRFIAVTIDDLPVVSTRSDLKNRQVITKKLLRQLRDSKVPAIGFVNENKLYRGGERDPAQIELLKMWLDAGLDLGNHTFSHRSLNSISLQEFEDDLIKGETITNELLQERRRRLRYFRHPYLHTGTTVETKNAFAAFLKSRGYTIAPITVDNADYIFSQAYDMAFDKGDRKLMKQIGDAYVPYMEQKLDYWERQSTKTFGREINQTLLLHANFINSDYFDDLARMMKRRGYRFISLDEALKDEAYALPDTFLGRAGISWMHRWTLDKGRENIHPNEPVVPDFVLKSSTFKSE